MDGKYMKTKRILIPTMTMIIISSLLFGCAATTPQESFDMLQQTDQIELEYAVPDYGITEDLEVALLPWLQLGSLESHPELRQAFDEYFGITGETGNKVGPIYYNTDTEQADQNVTLFMVLKNTDTRGHFINEESRDAIANMAIEYYGMDIDDPAATYAAINAYFNLLPDEALKEGEEPTFDNGKISRAAAMALLMRATTQVSEGGTPAVNKNFTSAVGSGQFTDFAAPMNVFAYYHTDLSKETGSTTNLMTKEDFDAYVKANKGEAVLDEDLFNTSMTKGEFIYMVTNYLLADYQAKLDEEGFVDIYENTPGVELTTVTDGGDITLEDAMAGAANDASTGIPSDMYAAFKQAVKYNLITEDAFEGWNATVSKSEAVELFTTMSLNYSTGIFDILSTGYDNAIVDMDIDEAITKLEEMGYNNIDPSVIERMQLLGYDLTDTEKLESCEKDNFEATLPDGQKLSDWVKSQGADYTLGWTLIFENGKAAGSNPTYGIYVRPGDPRYGERFELGSYTPSGDRITGTRDEWFSLQVEDGLKKAEEEGNLEIDEETGRKEIHIGGGN